MKLCLWADLKPEHIAALDAAVDEAGTRQVLAQTLQLVPEDNPLRHSVLLEFYVNNVRFARESGFSIEKLSAFFSIMKRNHDEMVEAFLPMEKSWEHFKALLLAHAVQRPPHSVGVFTLKEAQLITDFALNSYYRHFKLYRCAAACLLRGTLCRPFRRPLSTERPPLPHHRPPTRPVPPRPARPPARPPARRALAYPCAALWPRASAVSRVAPPSR